MNFLSRLLKTIRTPVSLTCPRCLGKGHVDSDDIIRLHQEGKWTTGACAYCNGSGHVTQDMLKIPADFRHLTSNLSASDRNAVINNYISGSFHPVDPKLDGCPVSESSRLRIEEAILLLLDFFDKENTQKRNVLIPHYSDFPLQYNGTEYSACETMRIVAKQMEVSSDNIDLGFYDDRVREVSTGSFFDGRSIFLQSREGDRSAGGLYWGRADHGKYEIWLNRKNLSQPESMVAMLAHEIAHIKLLGENRIQDNDEFLTDLTTVIFGLGIFNANEAFRTFKNSDSYGWQSAGYLSQMQWGYALALFAYVRGEKSPDWITHLTPNVKTDFLQGQSFIKTNPDKVFQRG